jgi:hypothetical protein
MKVLEERIETASNALLLADPSGRERLATDAH